MDIEPLIAVECEDCGVFVVTEPDIFTVIKIDDEYLGVTLCFHCERGIIGDLDSLLVEKLQSRGVKVLEW